jgi:hypothetical protein
MVCTVIFRFFSLVKAVHLAGYNGILVIELSSFIRTDLVSVHAISTCGLPAAYSHDAANLLHLIQNCKKIHTKFYHLF